MKEAAQQPADTSQEILALIEKDRRKIEELGRPAASVLRVHHHLQRKPIITVPMTAEQLSLSASTLATGWVWPHDLGFQSAVTGERQRTLRRARGGDRARPDDGLGIVTILTAYQVEKSVARTINDRHLLMLRGTSRPCADPRIDA